MKILIEKTSNWSFYKEAEFDHLEDCISRLLNSPDNPSKTSEFVVRKLFEYDFPYRVGSFNNKIIYNAGELDYVIEIYDGYRE